MEIDHDDSKIVYKGYDGTKLLMVRLTLGRVRNSPAEEVQFWFGPESFGRVCQSDKGDNEDICEG